MHPPTPRARPVRGERALRGRSHQPMSDSIPRAMAVTPTGVPDRPIHGIGDKAAVTVLAPTTHRPLPIRQPHAAAGDPYPSAGTTARPQEPPARTQKSAPRHPADGCELPAGR